MMTIFSKIIKGDIPCYKIAENERCFAFLDINPNTKGHTLCVPKREVDKLFDLPTEEYLDLMNFAQKVAKALEKSVPCKRIGMAVVGLEVPHAHIHLIPIERMEDITFNEKVTLSPPDFEQLAEKIRQNLETI